MYRLRALLVAVAAGAWLAGSEEAAQGQAPPEHAAELIYKNCYEHVGGFRVPITVLEGLVGSRLPDGFAYRTFDSAGTIGQFNVVGLACDQGGHSVTDVLINVVVNVPPDFSDGRPTLLRARTYTNSRKSLARFGLFCLGNVATLAHVESSVKIDPTTGVRSGHVVAGDDARSIELTTTAPAPARTDPATTLQHFTVRDGAVHGRIEWGNANAGLRQGTGAGIASVVLDQDVTASRDEITYVGGGQHVFAATSEPFQFFHRGLTRCPPGLDLIG